MDEKGLMRLRRPLSMLLAVLVSILWVPAAVGDERGACREITRLLAARGPAAGSYGIHIRDAVTGKTLFDRQGEVVRIPASSMKLVTSGAFLLELGWDYRFVTRVVAAEEPGPDGVLPGDLVLVGGGDPTLTIRAPKGGGVSALDDLARQIAGRGVRRIAGDLVMDDSFFDRELRQEGWPRDQWMHWYCASVTALPVERSCVTVRVEPGPAEGAPARVVLVPTIRSLRVEGLITTTTERKHHRIVLDLRPGANVLRVRGMIWSKSAGYESEIAVPDPTVWCGELFHRALVGAGVSVGGNVVIRRGAGGEPAKPVALARRETELFPVLAVMNRSSQNLFAECVLKTLGRERTGEGSFGAGSAVTAGLPKRIGLPAGELRQVDGSGLARENMVSPRFLTGLLQHLYAKGPAPVRFLETLASGGAGGGSLRKRLSDLGGAVRAKTGTIRGVSALAGFVRTKEDRKICFAFLVNDAKTPAARARELQDELCRILFREL